jgi:hypothetical protein
MAVEVLGDTLGRAGELLSVKIAASGDAGPYHIVNVTRLLRKALDPAKSTYREGDRAYRRLQMPAFHADQIPANVSLFKIPQNYGGQVYCVERTGEPGAGEFKALVEHHGLKGLEFRLVWSDGKAKPSPARSKPTPQAKPAAAAKRRPPATGRRGPGSSERPLKPGEAKDIRLSVARGYKALELPAGTSPVQAQRGMRKLIDAVVDGKTTLSSREAADLSVNLGCLWGQTLCDAAGWQWCVARVDGGRELPSVASPDRAYLVRPMHFIQAQLHKRMPGDNASLLLFNMIRSGTSQWAAKPNAYVTIG